MPHKTTDQKPAGSAALKPLATGPAATKTAPKVTAAMGQVNMHLDEDDSISSHVDDDDDLEQIKHERRAALKGLGKK